MEDAILMTENLTKKYGKALAVDHVSMTVNRGDIYGFIGVNGAGKTTFMRMVCGLRAVHRRRCGITGRMRLTEDF